MYQHILHQGSFGTIFVVVSYDEEQNTSCTYLESVVDVPNNYEALVKGLTALFDRYVNYGKDQLTSKQFHPAEVTNTIWRFSKGRVRAYGFFDGDNFILTRAAIKASDKTCPKNALKASLREHAEYFSQGNRHE